MKSDPQLAEKWGTTERSIRAWRADGAPLENDQRMRKWLAARRTLPPKTLEKLMATRKRERKAAIENTSPGAMGAASALRRLETAEEGAHRRYEQAVLAGDEVEIRLAQRKWQELADRLLRYDAQVEANRRDAGTLVPRVDVVRSVAMYCAWLRAAWENQNSEFIRDFVPESDRVRAFKAIRSRTYQALLDTAAMHAAQTNVPKWLSDAAASEVMEWIDFSKEDFDRLTDIFRKVCQIRNEQATAAA